ncbi:MAG: hypothetical protein ABEJ68_04195 [Halobacteriaceae archaeon]
MSITGLCQICESAEAVHQCNRCGALVCQSHWDPEAGLCVDCARETSPSGDGPGVP